MIILWSSVCLTPLRVVFDKFWSKMANFDHFWPNLNKNNLCVVLRPFFGKIRPYWDRVLSKWPSRHRVSRKNAIFGENPLLFRYPLPRSGGRGPLFHFQSTDPTVEMNPDFKISPRCRSFLANFDLGQNQWKCKILGWNLHFSGLLQKLHGVRPFLSRILAKSRPNPPWPIEAYAFKFLRCVRKNWNWNPPFENRFKGV